MHLELKFGFLYLNLMREGQNEAGIICIVFTDAWLPSDVEVNMLQAAGIWSVRDLWDGARAGAAAPALCCPWAFNFSWTQCVGRQKHARDAQVACVRQTWFLLDLLFK